MNKTSTYLLIVVCVAAAIYFWMQNGNASTENESNTADVEQTIEAVEETTVEETDATEPEATEPEATEPEATDDSEEK